MATYTEHYNLKKPATTDFVSIADLNGNADAIDAELYRAISSVTSSEEASTTAAAAHTVGSYFWMGGVLYRATAAIAIGDTITAGTNCTAVTIAGELQTAAGAYVKPDGGIPKTDLASGVQDSLDAADSAYQKPSGGIPATDMASAVQTSLGKADTALQAADKGAVNGVAGLDASGKVPSSQLPSYVDDVIEGYYYNGAFYSDSAHTTVIPAETGKIYVDLASDKSYRYSGSAYYRIDDITVDAALSDSSTNPVQNKAIGETLKAGTEATADWHLGFYLDANGDLCQVEANE